MSVAAAAPPKGSASDGQPATTSSLGHNSTTVRSALERFRGKPTQPSGAAVELYMTIMRGLGDVVMTNLVAIQDRAAELKLSPVELCQLGVLLAFEGPGTSTITVGQVSINRDAQKAWFKGEKLDLTAKEFDLLALLLENAGTVVTRNEIMRTVWETTWGSTKTVDMHISWLRRKLGDDAANPRFITTVRGIGFRFELPQE